MTATFLTGDALTVLRTLPAESVHCCITSPPYYGLRDYGTGTWEGGDAECEHKPVSGRQGNGQRRGRTFTAEVPQRQRCSLCGARRIDEQIGLEESPELFIARLVDVFREVRRVLRRDGVCFVNLGDSYSSGSGGDRRLGVRDSTRAMARAAVGAKPKDLLMMPFRLAFALRDDGWYLRSALPWVKRSCMPESCRDRPTSAIEYVFMLTRSERYYWDSEAVRQTASYGFTPKPGMYSRLGDAARQAVHTKVGSCPDGAGGSRNFRNSDLLFASLEEEAPAVAALPRSRARHLEVNPDRNDGGAPELGDRCYSPNGSPEPLGLMLDENGDPLALDVNPEPFPGAHFATFPTRLVAPLIKAGTSERGCCPACGAPWARVTERIGGKSRRDTPKTAQKVAAGLATAFSGYDDGSNGPVFTTIGWRPTCSCAPADPVPCTVLDPFSGAGTVALVADRLQRHSIGIELNPAYVEMARDRVRSDTPLLAEMEGVA